LQLGSFHSKTKLIPHCRCFLSDGALPDYHRSPARFFECAEVLSVSLDRAGKFGFPELGIAFWIGGEPAVPVAVPEAAMHKDCDPKSRQNNIRLPWHSLYICTKTNAFCPEQPLKHSFRSSICAADPRHVEAALSRGVNVGHFSHRSISRAPPHSGYPGMRSLQLIAAACGADLRKRLCGTMVAKMQKNLTGRLTQVAARI
jgi:hypothetical protein